MSVTSDGILAYTPPAGKTEFEDRFTYTLANAGGSSVATVTAVSRRTIYVNNTRIDFDGKGTKADPYG